MFNPKVSGIIAVAAFILSFLIGLFTGSQFFPVFLRALILAVIFFILSSVIYWVITQFLPDLLTSSSEESIEIDVPGSKVDISIDSSDDENDLTSIDESVPPTGNSGLAENSGQEDGGVIEAQSSAQGLDQRAQDDYNKAGEGDAPPSPDIVSGKSAVPGNDVSESGASSGQGASLEAGSSSEPLDVLPDLESMSGSFDPSSESEEEGDAPEIETEEESSSSAPPASVSGPSRSRKNSDPGDFNVQELASAIQTILRRDEKG